MNVQSGSRRDVNNLSEPHSTVTDRCPQRRRARFITGDIHTHKRHGKRNTHANKLTRLALVTHGTIALISVLSLNQYLLYSGRCLVGVWGRQKYTPPVRCRHPFHCRSNEFHFHYPWRSANVLYFGLLLAHYSRCSETWHLGLFEPPSWRLKSCSNDCARVRNSSRSD